ncbi:MAG: ABC transporter substrate-binding protein [Clostridia bacterium]|nr:ABC transporter substrate-binding protein [Clostridia bacterium]
MKKFFALSLALLMVLGCASVLSSCGKEACNTVKDDTIVIGVYEPASGDNAAGGKKETLGVKYANSVKPTVEIGGKTYKVELAFADNGSDNSKAVSAASQLIAKNAIVCVGSYGSGVSIAASKTFKDAGVPAVGITCTNPEVTAGNDHYFRICFLDPFQGTVLATYAKNTLGAKKAYVLAKQGSDYDLGLANYFCQGFGLNAQNDIHTFPDGTADFSSYITAAKEAVADVIFAPVSVNFAQLIVDKANDLGFEGVLLAGDTWDDNMIVDAAKENPNVNVNITTFYQEGANEAFDEGFRGWLESNATALADNGGNTMISAVSVMGYDSYMTVLSALETIKVEEGKSITSLDVKAALANMNTEAKAYEGVTGKIYFDATGDAVRNTAFIKKINTASGTWDFVAEQKAN